MPEPRYLAVKNFERHQHYGDRRAPPWIKLYNRLLDDYAFLALPEVQQRHLMMLWLIASRHHNRIPNDKKYIRDALHARSAVDLDALISSGFIETTDDEPVETQPVSRKTRHKNASTALAAREQHATSEVEVEKEERLSSAADAAEPGSLGSAQRSDPPPAVPASPEVPPAKASWPAEAVEVWAQVGVIPIGRMGKALKAAVDRYGWSEVKLGLVEYLDVNKRDIKACPESFAKAAKRWIDDAKIPLIDPETRWFTPKGEEFMRRGQAA